MMPLLGAQSGVRPAMCTDLHAQQCVPDLSTLEMLLLRMLHIRSTHLRAYAYLLLQHVLQLRTVNTRLLIKSSFSQWNKFSVSCMTVCGMQMSVNLSPTLLRSHPRFCCILSNILAVKIKDQAYLRCIFLDVQLCGDSEAPYNAMG